MPDKYTMPSSKKQLRIIILTVALAIIAALIIWGVAASIANKNAPTPTKEQLSLNVNSGFPSGAQSVTAALKAWSFPDFYQRTILNVESCYESNYYTGIEKTEALAKKTAKIFIDELYDVTDLKSKAEVTHAIANAYIHAVGDKYGVYRSEEQMQSYRQDLSGEVFGIGVTVTESQDGNIKVVSVVKGTPAEAAGISANDVIVAVNGTRVNSIGYSDATDMIRGEVDTEVVITVLRDGAESDIKIIRKKFDDTTVYYEMLDGKIGYIEILRFKTNTSRQFVEALNALEKSGAEGIIFDLRSNPGGLLSSVVDILSYIAPSGTELVSFSNGKNKVTATHGTTLEPTDNVYTLPSVVLVNSLTASAGELFAAALRDFDEMELLDVTIAGQTTYGKGVMQTTVDFPGGAALTMTIAFYNTPLGKNYDGEGVIPSSPINNEQDPLEHSINLLKEMLS